MMTKKEQAARRQEAFNEHIARTANNQQAKKCSDLEKGDIFTTSSSNRTVICTVDGPEVDKGIPCTDQDGNNRFETPWKTVFV